MCIKHWPAGFEKVKSINGKERPAHPPSIFEGVPLSEIPTPPPKPRLTERSSFEVRTNIEDELKAFLDADKVTFEALICKIATWFHRG